MKKLNSYALLVEILNGTITLEKGLAVSYEVEDTIWPSNPSYKYLPKTNENIYSRFSLFKESIVVNSPTY